MNKRSKQDRYSILKLFPALGRSSCSWHLLSACMILIPVFTIPTILSAQGNLTLHFNHFANGRKLMRDTGLYVNALGEPYSITKCRYYISNLRVKQEIPGEYLVDAFGSDSITVEIAKGTYNGLSFLVGVDSLHNVAGAQSGALDPLNDMFWTWNTGYVNWKLEGFSDSSTADLHRIEHHIGGYRYPYNTAFYVSLNFPEPLVILDNSIAARININCTLDDYWNLASGNSISQLPVVIRPGLKATAIAKNLVNIFKLGTIKNN